MRKITIAAGLGLSIVGIAVAASSQDEATPEAKAYFNLSFGGESAKARDFQYGLRIDQDARLTAGQPLPPLFQLDLSQKRPIAYLNGVNLRRPTHVLGQEEGGTAAETVEETEKGFFEGMWDGVTGFFGGLFGGDEEEEAAAEEAPAEEAAAAGEESVGYTWADWAVLAVGAAGLGFAGSEVADGQDDPDIGGGADGGADGGAAAGGDGTTPVGTPVGFASHPSPGKMDAETRERLEWLDGGTGQMGDLVPQGD